MSDDNTQDPPSASQVTSKVYTESEFAATQAEMRKAREEAKGHRLAASEAKAAREAAEAALIAEQNTAKEKLTAAETRILRAEVKAAAVLAGAIDPSDALAMIDQSKIVRDDNGEPTNLADLMAALKESKPYLFGTTATTPRSTSAPSSAPKPAPAQAKQAREMTPAEYAAAKAALGLR